MSSTLPGGGVRRFRDLEFSETDNGVVLTLDGGQSACARKLVLVRSDRHWHGASIGPFDLIDHVRGARRGGGKIDSWSHSQARG